MSRKKALFLVLLTIFIIGTVDLRTAAYAVDSAESPAVLAKTPENIIENLDFHETDVLEAIEEISRYIGWTVNSASDVSGQVSFRLKNVPALDALRIVLEMNSLAYSQEGGTVSIVPAQQFEQTHGRAFDAEIETKVLPVAYLGSEEMADYLQEIKSPQGRIYALENPSSVALLDTPLRVQELMKSFKELDVQRFKMVFELNFAKAAQLSEKIKPMLTKHIARIKIDEPSNKIIVTDTSAKIEEIRKLVDTFDHRDRKVRIEAKIVEIVLNDEHHLGIDWEAIVSDYQSLDMESLQEDSSGTIKERKLSIGLIANDDYSILIEALDTVGKVGVLSQIDLVTNNNKEAKILVGTSQFNREDETKPLRKKTEEIQEADLKDLGMKIFITPNIHSDGDTTLRIRSEISSLAGPGNDGAKPVKEISQAQTTLRIKKGMTVVIGGLVRQEQSNVTKKVPVLGDVPFLGNVFRSYRYDLQETESVVFITPKVSQSDIGTPVQAKR